MQSKIVEVTVSPKMGTFIKCEDEVIEKHDTLINTRNQEKYYVHTDDPYGPVFGIWMGKDKPEPDVIADDVLTVQSRLIGEYQ